MGLLGTVARTAVVAGTATRVSNNVSRRQYSRWAQEDAQQEQAQQQQQAAPVAAPEPAAAAGGGDVISQLKELAGLRDQGILTEEEFAQQKAKLLA